MSNEELYHARLDRLLDAITNKEVLIEVQKEKIQTLTEENKILEQQYKDDERTIKKLVAENKSLRCCSNCRYDCNMLIHGCCEKWVKE